MLRTIRIVFALLFLFAATALFLDFTGTVHAWLGWVARVQLLPAIMAMNVVVIASLILLTLLFGRIYCSVICPLGVMQDVFAKFGKMVKKNRYSYSPANNVMRYAFLVLMILSMIFGAAYITTLLAPYSAFGRIVQSLFGPLWQMGNNVLASMAERWGSYAFYEKDVWIRSGIVMGVAAVTLVALGILAWRNGRTYCNSVCPVGTALGFLSRWSLFRPVIDKSKCNGCGLCARNCKSACIDSKAHRIDLSRCVACMDCIGKCHKNAISYRPAFAMSTDSRPVTAADSFDDSGISRRKFLGLTALFATIGVAKSVAQKVDGGLAAIEDKKIPLRRSRIVPPGAQGHRNVERHCTGCQLCVAVCPNDVLRPGGDLSRALQPECSYERGYCRPECTRCSEVCPAGAIKRIDVAEKSSTQIGHAVWVKENCVPLTDGVECGNCARHCPVGAIQMIPQDGTPSIPAVDTERCIGCGACENLCPSRPFSAIYVEGHERHRTV